MNEIDRTLKAKPDHEVNAEKFLQLLNGLRNTYPTIKINASKSESTTESQSYQDMIEEMAPGYKDRQLEQARKLEEESVHTTVVPINIQGRHEEEESVKKMVHQVIDLAHQCGGVEREGQRGYFEGNSSDDLDEAQKSAETWRDIWENPTLFIAQTLIDFK